MPTQLTVGQGGAHGQMENMCVYAYGPTHMYKFKYIYYIYCHSVDRLGSPRSDTDTYWQIHMSACLLPLTDIFTVECVVWAQPHLLPQPL